MINLNRLFYVLDEVWTKIVVNQRKDFSDEGVCCARNAHASWLGKALQTGGDIHSVTEQVATSEHHVTDMDSDSELKARLWTS